MGSGGGSQGSLAEQGQQLFEQNGCSTCHLLDQQGRCPILRGLYNKPVQLNDGRTVMADDAYIRESILDPNAKIVSGFEPNIMPNFKGQLSEEQRDSVDCLHQVAFAGDTGIAARGRAAAARGDCTAKQALPAASAAGSSSKELKRWQP